jgi:hypothetical protein
MQMSESNKTVAATERHLGYDVARSISAVVWEPSDLARGHLK